MDLIEKAANRLNKKKRKSLVERAAEKLDLQTDDSSPEFREIEAAPVEPAPSGASDAVDKKVPAPDKSAHLEKSSLPHVEIDLKALEASGMITTRGGRSRAIEEYRVIKRPLLLKAFASDEHAVKNGNLIMVTSALPAEGKTFTSVNLAMSIAKERDLYVLLIDADLSRPNVARTLGIEGKVGLADLLEDSSLDVSDVILRTNIPNLSVITAGRAHEMGTELLASDRAEQIIREISSRYSNRIIIFDTSPVLASSEGGALAHNVGQVVFVVEAEKTSEGAVRGALDALSSCPNIGLVLNKTRTLLASSPYAQYYYGSYGSYYYYGADRK
ncbi:MAG: XrtA-associated tyrosine autokinase [Rhodospirillales bacterium]|nr:XrtA-associated tyrosine autokinase [Rhodospirillales bacterium]